MDKTMMFDLKEIEEALIKDMLLEVITALDERGYNPINQLVGYLLSGDPGYISSYKNARTKILKYDRALILSVLLNSYMAKDK